MRDEEIREIIDLMYEEAKRRKAPVFKAKETINDPVKRFFFVLLSTRTKDEKTLEGVLRLFKGIRNMEQLCSLSKEEIEKRIRGIGFYKVKARYIKEICKMLKDRGYRIPSTREELEKLPGIGRKVANVILSEIFNKKVIAVDTHVNRVSKRLGWVKESLSPKEVEKELYKIIPQDYWAKVNVSMVGFGQVICKPSSPLCEECPVKEYCNEYKKNNLK